MKESTMQFWIIALVILAVTHSEQGRWGHRKLPMAFETTDSTHTDDSDRK